MADCKRAMENYFNNLILFTTNIATKDSERGQEISKLKGNLVFFNLLNYSNAGMNSCAYQGLACLQQLNEGVKVSKIQCTAKM